MRFTRRRRFLVHSVQYRLLGAVVIYFLVVLAGIVAVVFAPLVLDFSSGPSYTPEKYEAAGVFLRLHERFWPVVLLIAVAIVLHSILISHRIAGPIYRFRKVFDAIARGDLTRDVHLRRNDHLKEEAEALNGLLRSLRTQVQTLRTGVSRLETAVRRPPESGENGHGLEVHLQVLKEALDFFRLEATTDESESL